MMRDYRYGNLYGIRRPHDQAEWDEMHDRDNPRWKRELEAEQEESCRE